MRSNLLTALGCEYGVVYDTSISGSKNFKAFSLIHLPLQVDTSFILQHVLTHIAMIIGNVY